MEKEKHKENQGNEINFSRAQSDKQYYEKNKFKLRKLKREFHSKRTSEQKEKSHEYSKEYYRTHLSEHLERCRKYYTSHKEERREYHRNYRKKARMEVLQYYSKEGIPQCECCGEKQIEFLAIDHIEGKGNKHRKKIHNHIELFLKRKRFPSGYRILCHNCNLSLGFYGYCPHNVKTEVN